jgi:hypothetical protein
MDSIIVLKWTQLPGQAEPADLGQEYQAKKINANDSIFEQRLAA